MFYLFLTLACVFAAVYCIYLLFALPDLSVDDRVVYLLAATTAGFLAMFWRRYARI